ncbi:hypothetical protein ABID26_002203 [Mesorhizobium shonense]|uniref:Transcriptional regulator n=1 Tax=Mesorhizobium shonense TaxID=1209948 RepID=A0ABV2HQD6_9HYPH
MRAGNVFSLVKRTLFEANSKARRLGKASLTSVLTGRLLLARSLSVNPGTANIAPDPELGSHAKNACNFLAPFFKDEEESDRLPAVFSAGFVQEGGMNGKSPLFRRNQPVNDNEERPVTIITGRVWRRKGGKPEGVHVMLVAPDDDSAVRRALESLAAEGFAEAELDQIGDMEGAPDEEPHLSAYQGALEGEVSIVTFDEPV